MFHFCFSSVRLCCQFDYSRRWKVAVLVTICSTCWEKVVLPDSFMHEWRPLISGVWEREMTHTGHIYRWAKACVVKMKKSFFFKLFKMWHIQGTHRLKYSKLILAFVYVPILLVCLYTCRISTSTGSRVTFCSVSSESGLLFNCVKPTNVSSYFYARTYCKFIEDTYFREGMLSRFMYTGFLCLLEILLNMNICVI